MTEKMFTIIQPDEMYYVPELTILPILIQLITRPSFVIDLYDNSFGPTGYPDTPIFHTHNYISEINPDNTTTLTIDDDERLLAKKHEDPKLGHFISNVVFQNDYIIGASVNETLFKRLERLKSRNRSNLARELISDLTDTFVRGEEVIQAGNGIRVEENDPLKLQKIAQFVRAKKDEIEKYNSSL